MSVFTRIHIYLYCIKMINNNIIKQNFDKLQLKCVGILSIIISHLRANAITRFNYYQKYFTVQFV